MTYQVKIDIFEGPLDLLLHLIQKDDLDIYDIPISEITAKYLDYLDILKELNLNVAGEFLVMAATLMQIKARTLLPSVPGETEAEGPDPRTELVQRLIEYQKIKEAARMLEFKHEGQRDVFYRGAPIFGKHEEVLDIDLTKLLDAFSSVFEMAETNVRDIIVEEIPVEIRIREIIDILDQKPFITFNELFPETATRKTLVVTFLALLELIRLKQVRVTQSANFGEIHIHKAVDQVDVNLVPSA